MVVWIDWYCFSKRNLQLLPCVNGLNARNVNVGMIDELLKISQDVCIQSLDWGKWLRLCSTGSGSGCIVTAVVVATPVLNVILFIRMDTCQRGRANLVHKSYACARVFREQDREQFRRINLSDMETNAYSQKLAQLF